jgi:hypothetical protein
MTDALADLENFRQSTVRARRRAMLTLVGIIAGGAAALGLFLWAGAAALGPLAFAFLAGIPIATVSLSLWYLKTRIWHPKYAYLERYKTVAFSAVCAQQFPGIAYRPDAGISYEIIDRCGLFPWVSAVYQSEDRFEGRWGKTAVCFAEAVAQRAVERGPITKRRTEYVTYFRGLVFIADFNKHFHSTTRLVPCGSEPRARAGESRVELEDPAFMQTFDTWSTDQTDARYVLSPSLMERLGMLHRAFPGMRAKFEGGRLLLFLPRNQDLFETTLDTPAADPRVLASFNEQVKRCLEIVQVLDLDTRIWSKT